jgi:hypothetical protein
MLSGTYRTIDVPYRIPVTWVLVFLKRVIFVHVKTYFEPVLRGLGQNTVRLEQEIANQCCGSGSGGSVINLPPGSGSINYGLRIRIRIRHRILTIFQRFEKFKRKVILRHIFFH